MVSLNISQGEERWAVGKTCHCGIHIHDFFFFFGGGGGGFFQFAFCWMNSLQRIGPVQEGGKRMVLVQSLVGLEPADVLT